MIKNKSPYSAQLWNCLNEHQHAAAMAGPGQFVLAATAGSGKTLTIVLRIEQLVQSGVLPARIGAFTFSRDAAQEMTTRAALLGLSDVRIGTLHSLCWDIVQSDTPGVFGGPNLELAENKISFRIKDVIGRDFKDRDLDVGEANRVFKLAKAQGLSFHPAQSKVPGLEILAFFQKNITKQWLAPSYVAVYKQVEEFRHASRLMDYDDMLVLAYLFLKHTPAAAAVWASRYDYLIIDEAQDSSWVQNAVVALLSAQCKNVMHVGDVCQSLYRWRGALPEEFVDYAKQYTKLVLPVNYRSTQEICAHATNLTAGEKWNITGPTLPHEGAPSDRESVLGITYTTPEQEALFIADKIKLALQAGTPLREIAVLYRVTSLMPTIEEALLHAKIPYVVWSGATFYVRKEVRDLLAYLRVAALRDPDGSETRRALLAPFRYIGNKALNEAEVLARDTGTALLDALGKVELGKGQRQKFHGFYKTLMTANKMMSANAAPAKILEFIIEDTHYDTYVKEQAGSDGPDPDSGKAANVHKLVSIANNFTSTVELLTYIDQITAEMEAARGKREADAVVLSSIHKCVSPDTLTETEWGLVPIHDIPETGVIANASGPVAYHNKVAYMERPMIRITTRDGYSLNVTLDHRLMAWNGHDYVETQAQALKLNMFLRLRMGVTMEPSHPAVLPPSPIVTHTDSTAPPRIPTSMSRELAEFLGFFLTSGTLQRHSVQFDLPHPATRERVLLLLEHVFGITIAAGSDGAPDSGDTHYPVIVVSPLLAIWLRDIEGLQQNVIPKCVLASDVIIHNDFLCGLMDNTKIVLRFVGGPVASAEWRAPSELVARTVQTMLLRLGVISKRALGDNGWTVSIHGAQLRAFHRCVLFTDPAKNASFFGDIPDDDTYNVLPVSEMAVRAWSRDQFRYDRQNALEQGRVTRAAAQRVGLIDELEFHHDRIVALEWTQGPAMCVEVPEGGRFLQNGFDGCNSKGLEWDIVFGIGWNDGILPHQFNPDPGEELRLAYVCMTRAKKRFEASCVQRVVTPRGIVQGTPSPFFAKAKLVNKLLK